jgi:hypothetical protein
MRWRGPAYPGYWSNVWFAFFGLVLVFVGSMFLLVWKMDATPASNRGHHLHFYLPLGICVLYLAIGVFCRLRWCAAVASLLSVGVGVWAASGYLLYGEWTLAEKLESCLVSMTFLIPGILTVASWRSSRKVVS